MIINLLSHEIKLLQDGKIRNYPSNGIVRLSEVIMPAGEWDGIQLVQKHYGTAEKLPPPQDGVLIIVPSVVRLAYPNRADLASPGQRMADDEGNIVLLNLIVNQ